VNQELYQITIYKFQLSRGFNIDENDYYVHPICDLALDIYVKLFIKS